MGLSTPTTLTSGGGAAAASFTTASVTSATDGLLLLTVHLYVASGSVQPVAPTVTGLGRTWTQVGTDVIVDNAGSDRATMFLFRAMGPGATGALTITPPGAMKATWILQQILGADTSGVEGAGAIGPFVKSEPGSAATVSTTSPALSNAASMLYGGVGKQTVTANDWGNGWTKSIEVLTNSITYAGIGYYQGDDQLTQTVTLPAATRVGAYAVEVKAGGVVSKAVKASWHTYVPAGPLPGTIPGVEPETHQHNPVLMTPGGWLYRVVESDLASGNHPAMMKSLDGGCTWAECDPGNRPVARDLEAVSAVLKGSIIAVYVNRDTTLWRCRFDTATDTWGATEVVKTGMSSSGVEQAAAAVALANGDEWVAYSNTLAGTNNQAAICKRTGANTYGAEIDLGGDTAINWTVPHLVLGAGGVTHVFLKDSTNHRLYWRTLSSAGVLSAATRIDSTGTSTQHVAHTNAVVYQSGGQEVVAILFTDTARVLRCVRIVAGVVQAPEVVSSSAVLMDPGLVTNGGAVAHLATDGTNLYAAWARASDGSVMMAKRTAGWSAESMLVPFTEGPDDYACYVYCDVNQYPAELRSGAKVLSVVYDAGFHTSDISDLRYTEVTLTSAPVATSRATSWHVRKSVTATRAASWNVGGSPKVFRSTSWRVDRGVTATRPTSWHVTRAVAPATRSTSWHVGLSAPKTLTSGGAASAASHTTAAVTTTKDGLLLLTVHLYVSAGSVQPTAPTVAGLGRTWTQVGSDVIVDDAGGDRATMFLFRAMGPGATGTLTITPPAAMKVTWILQQITGADTSGTEGSGAIGSFAKSEPGSVVTITTPAPEASSYGGMLYGGVGKQNVTANEWGNGWTKSAEVLTNTFTYAGVAYYQGTDRPAQSVTLGAATRAGAFIVDVKAAGALGKVARSVSTRWHTYGPAGPLPGFIDGVEPETHQHNPTHMVPAGWLYRVMESGLDSGDHPAMMKSVDGGSTWVERDAANRPKANDLEGVTTILRGTKIHVYVNRDDTCWRIEFDTTTDRWGAQETVKTGMTNSGVEQAVMATVLSNGDEWITYSNSLSGTNNQAAVRKRTGVNTYGAEIDLGENLAINWTVPQVVLGAGDVTHVFLKDSTNHRIYWRTLSAAGVLSAPVRIDSAGASPNHVAHTNAVVYQSGGQEALAILYTDAARILRCVRIIGGVVQAPEQVSPTAVLMDPGQATNGGAVAHLATDGTNLYAVWARASDGSVMMSARKTGWSAEAMVVPFEVGPEDYAEYAYCDVNQYPPELRGGAKVLSVVYDRGFHENSVSDVWYTEVNLGSSGVTVARSTWWSVGITAPGGTRFVRQGGSWVPALASVRSGGAWV